MRVTMGALLTAMLASAALAQTPAALEETYARDRFAVSVEEVAPGVHVMRRDPSWRFPVQATTTLIVNADDAVLVDGGFGRHAQIVIEAVRQITDKPVSAIVNTHWHGDHNVGHAVFRQAWPQARVIAHARTRSAMADDGVMDYVRRAGQEDDAALLGPSRERLSELQAQGASAERLAYMADVIAGLPEVRDDYARWTMVLADETFTERMTLHRGGRRIDLLHLGAANTEGDLIVWLPEARVVIAGDVVVHPTPYGFGSHPASWAGVLRAINDLDYAVLVPGHGALQYDKSYVARLAQTMDHVAAEACRAVRSGALDAEAVRAAIDWGAVEPGFTGEDPFLAGFFDSWFKQPISAAALADIESGAAACP